jgi:hypothetical protein
MNTIEPTKTDVTARILRAVKGNPASVQALAGAIAQNDGEAVRGLLAERGVALDPTEIGEVMSRGASGASPTMT